MSSSTNSRELARRYVTALFDLAQDAGALDAVEKDLRQLQSLLSESDSLARLVESPLLSREDKASAFDAVLEKARAHKLTRNLGRVLASNRRLDLLPVVISEFLVRLAESRGEASAEVIVPAALSSAQLSEIEGSLKKALGRKVNVAVKEDSSLLGGLIVKIGGRMFDYSVAGKLERLKLALKRT